MIMIHHNGRSFYRLINSSATRTSGKNAIWISHNYKNVCIFGSSEAYTLKCIENRWGNDCWCISIFNARKAECNILLIIIIAGKIKYFRFCCAQAQNKNFKIENMFACSHDLWASTYTIPITKDKHTHEMKLPKQSSHVDSFMITFRMKKKGFPIVCSWVRSKMNSVHIGFDQTMAALTEDKFSCRKLLTKCAASFTNDCTYLLNLKK